MDRDATGGSRRWKYGVGVLFVGLLWVIAVAPAAVEFALTVGLAAAWCAWLERH